MTSVFAIKNGLSALLMRAIWEASGEEWFYFHFDNDEDHRRDVEAVLQPLGYRARRVDTSLTSSTGRHVTSLRPTALYRTRSNSSDTRRFLKTVRKLDSHREEFIVQHGAVEMLAYIQVLQGQIQEPIQAYYLLHADEIRRRCPPPPNAQPIQLREYPAIPVEPLTFPLHQPPRRSVFAMNRLIDADVVPSENLSAIIEAFLDRRPAMHYVIKPHPRPSPLTIELFIDRLERRSLTYEVLPADSRMLELEVPNLRCDEISTFYSSAATIVHKLYGLPFDWMVPDLAAIPQSRNKQAALISMLGRLFGESRNLSHLNP